MRITFSDGTSINNVNKVYEHYEFGENSDHKVHVEIYLSTNSLIDGFNIFESITGDFVATNAKGTSITYSDYSTQSIRSTLNDDESELIVELIKEIEED